MPLRFNGSNPIELGDVADGHFVKRVGDMLVGENVAALQESSGPTLLALSAVADGQYLRRVGAELRGATPSGGSGQMIVPLVSDAAGVTWTNMPAAVAFFAGSHRFATKVDLTNYSQVRLIVNKQATAGATNAIVRLRYRTSFDTTAANWLQIGASSVQVAVNTTNTVLDSGWIDLVAGAKADVFVCLDGLGGDGVIDAQYGGIAMHLR